MPKTDAESLAELQSWRDNVVAALKEPETVSGYGGMSDSSGVNTINRMGGRSQLLRELEVIDRQITEIETRTPFTRNSIAVT